MSQVLGKDLVPLNTVWLALVASREHSSVPTPSLTWHRPGLCVGGEGHYISREKFCVREQNQVSHNQHL